MKFSWSITKWVKGQKGHKMSKNKARALNCILWICQDKDRFLPVFNGKYLWGFEIMISEWYAFEVNGKSYPRGTNMNTVWPPYSDGPIVYKYEK